MNWVYKALAVAALVSRLMIIAENAHRIYERKQRKKLGKRTVNYRRSRRDIDEW